MRVSGHKELAIALRVLGRGLPTSSIDRSMAASSKPMLNEAIAGAKRNRQPGRRPRGGHLDEGIVFRRKKDSTKTNRLFVIGAINRARYIAHLVEFRVRPHWQPRRFGGIMHPGHPGYPFMRPAYDEHADKTVERFGVEIWKEIERMVARLNKGGRRR